MDSASKSAEDVDQLHEKDSGKDKKTKALDEFNSLISRYQNSIDSENQICSVDYEEISQLDARLKTVVNEQLAEGFSPRQVAAAIAHFMRPDYPIGMHEQLATITRHAESMYGISGSEVIMSLKLLQSATLKEASKQAGLDREALLQALNIL